MAEQESSPQLVFKAWDHQGNMDINEKCVLGVCVSVSSLSPALQRQQWVCVLDVVPGPCRMLELDSGLGYAWAGAAAAGALGSTSWDLEIHQIPL